MRVCCDCCGGRPRGPQKKPRQRALGLENAMRVVLVRRGATRGAYADRGRGAREGKSVYWAVVVDTPTIAALVRGPKNPVDGRPLPFWNCSSWYCVASPNSSIILMACLSGGDLNMSNTVIVFAGGALASLVALVLEYLDGERRRRRTIIFLLGVASVFAMAVVYGLDAHEMKFVKAMAISTFGGL